VTTASAVLDRDVSRLSAYESAATVAEVLVPLLARGVIARRPAVVGLLERVAADRRAVARLQVIRARHGGGPAVLRIPGRQIALVLSPPDVWRVLDETPEPFAAATREKRGALEHFQPDGVLISRGAERTDRRRFSEAVLDTARPVHALAGGLTDKVREEATALLHHAARRGLLTWDDFAVAWWRMVRRVVLGDGARDDHTVTDLLASLRRDANWAYLRPRRERVRARFAARVRAHLARGEAGSLASLVVSVPSSPVTAPEQQVPQWLFAFDAAGMATFRALALLDAHPAYAASAREESDTERPLLRACVLESVRLWPTTPAVLRETTTETVWGNGTLPAGTALVIFTPFFHRDDESLPYADRFEPDVWLDPDGRGDWPLIPFSAGPVECPGRNLVLLTTSHFLSVLLSGASVRGGGLDPGAPLPATLSPFGLRFSVST
jgi:cytochrome P450